MAEVAVTVLIKQLGALLVEEAKLLSWVSEDIAQLRNELVMMEAFLRDADQKRRNDGAVDAWVRQVRELAYYVGDSLDGFLPLLTEPSPGLGFCRKCGWYAMHYLLLHRCRISCRTRVINRRIQSASKLKDTFSLNQTSGDTGAPKTEDDRRLMAPLFVEDSRLVGIDGHKNELVAMLLGGGEERQLISIVGMGGMGKTTLARKVLKDKRVESHFQRGQAWITVSRSYSSEELFREMITTLIPGTDRRELLDLSSIQLVEKLRSCLDRLRYLIVLDDVWDIGSWEDLKLALPENNEHSRVIITTRTDHVAQHCSQARSLVYELKPLSEEDSWSLFCKTVFKILSCPPELEELTRNILKSCGRNILKSCGGLPLAIVLIGGLLSTREHNREEWYVASRSLVSESFGGEELGGLNRILWLSYEDLPPHLKPCYLYFGMFPDDYLVHRGMLTRQLVAEGFIVPDNNMVSLEDIAERYIGQLISRNLIQVERKDAYGRAKFCKVHDLMHDLLVAQCKEQNFVVIAQQGDHGGYQVDESVHRLSVTTGQQVPDDTRLKQVRSLFMFPGAATYLNFSGFRMLRVLNLQGAPLDVYPGEISNLYHLRYLNLRRTKIKELPNSISRLRKLQTLDLKRSDISKLPDEIVGCTSLRNILIRGAAVGEMYATLPIRIGSLVCLQKLCFLRLKGVEHVTELGKLTQLRNLAISDVTAGDMTALADSIRNMNQLRSLHVTLKDQNEAVDVYSLLTQRRVRRFTFFGRLLGLSQLESMSLGSLTKIWLGNSRLEEDPFHVLQHLPNLSDLRFQNTYWGQELSCGPDGFQKLTRLSLCLLYNLCSVKISAGAMPLLHRLEIVECPRLVTAPHGIEHLASLRELFIYNVPDLIGSLRTTELHKVEHIPIRVFR